MEYPSACRAQMPPIVAATTLAMTRSASLVELNAM